LSRLASEVSSNWAKINVITDPIIGFHGSTFAIQQSFDCTRKCQGYDVPCYTRILSYHYRVNPLSLPRPHPARKSRTRDEYVVGNSSPCPQLLSTTRSKQHCLTDGPVTIAAGYSRGGGRPGRGSSSSHVLTLQCIAEAFQ
jgi:hypothetical protein